MHAQEKSIVPTRRFSPLDDEGTDYRSVSFLSFPLVSLVYAIACSLLLCYYLRRIQGGIDHDNLLPVLHILALIREYNPIFFKHRAIARSDLAEQWIKVTPSIVNVKFPARNFDKLQHSDRVIL